MSNAPPPLVATYRPVVALYAYAAFAPSLSVRVTMLPAAFTVPAVSASDCRSNPFVQLSAPVEPRLLYVRTESIDWLPRSGWVRSVSCSTRLPVAALTYAPSPLRPCVAVPVTADWPSVAKDDRLRPRLLPLTIATMFLLPLYGTRLYESSPLTPGLY